MTPRVERIVEDALGNRLDEGVCRSLRKIQREFSRTQAQLIPSLTMGILPPEEYLSQLNVSIKSMMDRIQVALGEERFNIVFGEAGKYPEGLADRSIFMAVAKAALCLAKTAE